MDKSALEELVFRHIKHVDKWYRLYMGLQSKLTRFENETLFITIEVNTTWKKDHITTASLLANDWRKFNPELFSARKYRVKIIPIVGITGFELSMEEAGDRNKVQLLIDSLKAQSRVQSSDNLIEISGNFE